MPDIFDQVSDQHVPAGDIFDQVAGAAVVSEEPVTTPKPRPLPPPIRERFGADTRIERFEDPTAGIFKISAPKPAPNLPALDLVPEAEQYLAPQPPPPPANGGIPGLKDVGLGFKSSAARWATMPGRALAASPSAPPHQAEIVRAAQEGIISPEEQADLASRRSIPQQVLQGLVGGAAVDLPMYAALGPALGPIGAMAAPGAVEGLVEGGPAGALKGAAKGAVMGATLHGLGRFGRAVQVPANAALLSGETALAGGDTRDIAAAGIVGAGFGLMGGKRERPPALTRLPSRIVAEENFSPWSPVEGPQPIPPELARTRVAEAGLSEKTGEAKYNRFYQTLARQHPDWGVNRLNEEAAAFSGWSPRSADSAGQISPGPLSAPTRAEVPAEKAVAPPALGSVAEPRGVAEAVPSATPKPTPVKAPTSYNEYAAMSGEDLARYLDETRTPPEVLAEYPELKPTPAQAPGADRVEAGAGGGGGAGKTPVAEQPVGAGKWGERGALNPQPATPKYEIQDPQVRARVEAASMTQQKPVAEKIKDAWRSLKSLWRPYRELPRGAEYGPATHELKRLEKAGNIAEHRVVEKFRNEFEGLDRNQADAFALKAVFDDLKGQYVDSPAGTALPFGLTPESLNAEHARLSAFIDKDPVLRQRIEGRRQFWENLKAEYSSAMRAAGFDVSERLNRPDYFHHMVLEKMEEGAGGPSLGMNTVQVRSGRGFLRSRTDNALDYSTDYVKAEYEVAAEMMKDAAEARTVAWVKDPRNGYNITPRLKAEAQQLNNERVEQGLDPDAKWQDLVPKGYELWQGRKGRAFQRVFTIPEERALEILKSIDYGDVVFPDEVKNRLAVGMKFQEVAIPAPLAHTLDTLGESATKGAAKIPSGIQNAWKQWQLLSPGRVIKYNLRNLSGDAEATFVGNPRAFLRVPEAVRDLYAYYRSGQMAPDLRDWFERGGLQSTLQAQEMGNIKGLEQLRGFFDRAERGVLGTAANVTMAPLKAYWRAVRLPTDFREAILRYANYRDYLRQMGENGGQPKNFGASMPEEVTALASVKDRAYKLSNDLLGAYDEVSVAGQWLRKYMIPFWSYQELNFRRYIQIAKNAARDGTVAESAARKLLGAAVFKTPYLAYRAGTFAAKAMGLWAALQTYNMTVHGDEEKDLPENVRSRPHIVLGRGPDGKVQYFSRLGNLPDVLEWFGYDESINNAQSWLNGAKTLKDVTKSIASDTAKVPVSVANKIWQSQNPLEFKLWAELLSHTTTYPDISKTRTIHDGAEYLFDSVAAGDIYRRVAGKPMRDMQNGPAGSLIGSAKRALVYESDPGESAYYSIQDQKQKFLKSIGKGGEGTFSNPKSEALRNLKLSIRYQDKKAFEKYLTEYVGLGGTASGMEQSIKSFDPLYGLKPKEQRAFIQSLSPEDQMRVAKAQEYYKQVFNRPALRQQIRETGVRVPRRSAAMQPPPLSSLPAYF